MKKEKKENLIPVSENMASFLTNAGVTTGITTISGSGLFQATVNPATLMTYADNTISSIVMEGGKISTHAGFQTVSSAVAFAPMLAFQLSSMITGQYYFNLLSKQMKSISKSVNQIIIYLEDKDKAILSETQNRLEELSIQMRNRTTDEDVLFRIHQHIDKVSEISALYGTLCEHHFEEYTKTTAKKTWENFSQAEFHKYWKIYESSLFILAYARALEFVIRLEKNMNLYSALQQEYAERFREYDEITIVGIKLYLSGSCQKTIKAIASCAYDIYQTFDHNGMWIPEKDKREEKETFRFLENLFSESTQLSSFNIQFKENTEKIFQNITTDKYLFFDAATHKYYLEGE